MQYFQTPEMKALGLPFSAAVRVGEVLYLSGALGNLPGTLKLAEAPPRDFSSFSYTMRPRGGGGV